jgi:hypothetical protein
MSGLGTYALCGVAFAVLSISLGIVSPANPRHHPIVTPLALVFMWPIFATILILSLLLRRR